MVMSPVIHFEMPAEDRKRMIKFYTKAFGWETEQLGEEMGNYVLVTTTETNSKGIPKKPGMINGGFYQKSDDMPETNFPSIVISVEEINKAIKKIKESGGKILGEVMEIPEIGLYNSFLDTEGNRVGIMQSYPMK